MNKKSRYFRTLEFLSIQGSCLHHQLVSESVKQKYLITSRQSLRITPGIRVGEEQKNIEIKRGVRDRYL